MLRKLARNMGQLRPLRVVLLIDELEVRGGTENHLLDLLSGLNRERVEPTVVVLALAGLIDDVARLGVATFGLRIRRLLGVEGGRTLLRLKGILESTRPDLVVTYHPGADIVGPLAARLVGSRVVSCRRDLGFTRTRKHRLLQRPINYLVDGMIAVSRAVQQSVVANEGFRAARIRVIPNGCDLEVYKPGPSSVRAELGIGDDEIVLGTLSNFGRIKGYDVIVPVAIELVRRHPMLRVVFVGKDEAGEAELPKYREMARFVGDRIIFAGSRRDVPPVLSAMDVFLQASRSEGFSNSILQAMACARPVIATDVGGNRELVDPGCGILVPADDRDALERAVGCLLVDPEGRRKMGQAGRVRAGAHFSKARMVEGYEQAFRSFAGLK